MERQVGIESIDVYVDFENGKTVCICQRENKRCSKPCTPDVVERDRYRGWKDTFYVDQYGKSKA